ncbi:MAG: DNA-deoxyinosine glycosylase [Oscillospiraceae bacterium]
MKNNEYRHITHSFPPFYKSSSKLLILGSFPSVKSREQGFFYGHPHNRFWKMLAAVYGEAVPNDIPEKKALLERHEIALYDVIYACDIVGSSDSSIRNVTPADIGSIIADSQISRIVLNGKTAERFFRKYQDSSLLEMVSVMPSTSPANAAFSLEKLIEVWGEALK